MKTLKIYAIAAALMVFSADVAAQDYSEVNYDEAVCPPTSFPISSCVRTGHV